MPVSSAISTPSWAPIVTSKSLSFLVQVLPLLTGIYLLKQVEDFLASLDGKAHTGLYRDDGLIYIEDANGPLINKIEKALHRIFKSNHLKISVEQKGHTVNFLDATELTDRTNRTRNRMEQQSTLTKRQTTHHPS